MVIQVYPVLSLPCGEQKKQNAWRVKYWEIIADNLHKAGWSLGWVPAFDLEGRTIWIVDAHGYGKRFIARDHEKLIVRNGIGRISDRTNYESERNMSARDRSPVPSMATMNTT